MCGSILRTKHLVHALQILREGDIYLMSCNLVIYKRRNNKP